jgi:transcriptional regulator with XRE-family HTH domain
MHQYITIRQLREFRGFGQSYMANMLKITQSAYSKIESFKATTTETNYQIISILLGTKVEYIRSNKIPIVFAIEENAVLSE